jgi:hypothetical protein
VTKVARLLGNEELLDIRRSLIARTTPMIAMYEVPGQNVCSFDEHNRMALSSGSFLLRAERPKISESIALPRPH